jgi:hypothetical protein
VTDQAQQRAIQGGIAVVALFFLPALGDVRLFVLFALLLLVAALATLHDGRSRWRAGLAAVIGIAVAAAAAMLTSGAVAGVGVIR